MQPPKPAPYTYEELKEKKMFQFREVRSGKSSGDFLLGYVVHTGDHAGRSFADFDRVNSGSMEVFCRGLAKEKGTRVCESPEYQPDNCTYAIYTASPDSYPTLVHWHGRGSASQSLDVAYAATGHGFSYHDNRVNATVSMVGRPDRIVTNGQIYFGAQLSPNGFNVEDVLGKMVAREGYQHVPVYALVEGDRNRRRPDAAVVFKDGQIIHHEEIRSRRSEDASQLPYDVIHRSTYAPQPTTSDHRGVLTIPSYDQRMAEDERRADEQLRRWTDRAEGGGAGMALAGSGKIERPTDEIGQRGYAGTVRPTGEN